jgi:hypothetical protein
MVTISDMDFSKFFSEQARKPSGIFGQVVMSAVFDIGNAFILKPGGLFVVAFEDIKQLEKRNLNKNIFHLYTANDVIDLLANSGFSTDIGLKTKSKGNQVFHCIVAKTGP